MSEYLNEVKGKDIQDSIDELVTQDSKTIEMQGESVIGPTDRDWETILVNSIDF